MWKNVVLAQAQPSVQPAAQPAVQQAVQPAVQQVGQQAGQPAVEQGVSGMLQFGVMMAIVFGIFYFMMILPQKRKEKERKKMIDNVKTGERVIFSGGMIGTVANVKDNVLVVKVAENVKIEILRGAVLRVLDKGAEPTDVEAR